MVRDMSLLPNAAGAVGSATSAGVTSVFLVMQDALCVVYIITKSHERCPLKNYPRSASVLWVTSTSAGVLPHPVRIAMRTVYRPGWQRRLAQSPAWQWLRLQLVSSCCPTTPPPCRRTRCRRTAQDTLLGVSDNVPGMSENVPGVFDGAAQHKPCNGVEETAAILSGPLRPESRVCCMGSLHDSYICLLNTRNTIEAETLLPWCQCHDE